MIGVGVIGLGQAGGTVADMFAKEGVYSVAINYSSTDLETCVHVDGKLQLYGSEGVGKSRERAEELFNNNYETAISFIRENFSQPSTNLIFITFSTGGGSGSGIAPFLTELLINEMPDKVFVCIPILPSLSEPITAQVNTLNTLSLLSDLNVCILPVDNDKGVRRAGIKRLYKAVNTGVIESILSLIFYTEKHSIYGNLDTKDLLSLFDVSGFSCIGNVDLSKLKNQFELSVESISEMVQTSWEIGVFANPSYDQIVKAGVIFEGQENLLPYIDSTSVLSVFNNPPLDIYEGVYVGEGGSICTFLTGLQFNQERLQQIEDAISSRSSLFNSNQQSTSVALGKPVPITTISKSKQKKALSEIVMKYRK